MTESNLKKWQTNSSKYIVNDRWLKLRADSCATPDGHIIEPFYVFEYSDWVNCFVVDDNNDVLMVLHYRHGIEEYLPELVSDGVEESDISPEEGIRRELEEELGYTGGEIHHIGTNYPNPANHTNKVHSFIAIGGRCTQTQKLEKGEDLHIIKVPFKKLANEIESRTLTTPYQSMHLLAMFLALKFIRHSQLKSVQKLKMLL